MQTELVDDEEFAAIEFALNAANALKGRLNHQPVSNHLQQSIPNFTPPIQPNQQYQTNRTGTIDSFFQGSSRPSNATNPPSHQTQNQNQSHQQQQKSKATDQQPKTSSFLKTVVSFQLMKNRRVSASTNNFNQRVIDVLKSCKDNSYDPSTREWSFGVEFHDDVMQQLKGIQNVETKPLPSFVLRVAKQTPTVTPTPVTSENPVDTAMKRLPQLIEVSSCSVGCPNECSIYDMDLPFFSAEFLAAVPARGRALRGGT